MNSKGMLVIISGPSGSGKGTVVKRLDPEKGYALSISMTTRKKRPMEVDGKDYFFCTEEDFTKKRDNNELLEHAVFCGNLYGTPRFYVEEQIAKGKAVVLEIDVEGALQVRRKFGRDCVLIFLMPPTMEELTRRLFNRNTEDMLTIEQRIIRASNEIKFINEYDYLVINDEVDTAVKKIDTIVEAEYLKPHRNLFDIDNFKGDEFDVTSFLYGADEFTEQVRKA
ncbi:guanylate kinase [Anaeropeptidivorans aminofermentans]|jgi:guanylate kinase|uniref:guanylate kinase n=1 Tax=Anaeropeptidivorans aminofermentans TaxID=2934315 RepID=UPI002024D770|nr:guanylate kinase [Anaeropeptidivorans aminofermentans]MBE6013386.1 guanylate kinase [Lachnospiraceae bacterium]